MPENTSENPEHPAAPAPDEPSLFFRALPHHHSGRTAGDGGGLMKPCLFD